MVISHTPDTHLYTFAQSMAKLGADLIFITVKLRAPRLEPPPMGSGWN